MEILRNLKNLNKDDVTLAGGKGASLGEMNQAGIPVPPGFVVLSSAFERFVEETNLNVEIDAKLHAVDHNAMHTVEEASEKIQSLILQTKMLKDIADEVKKEFKKLGAKYVAVRSSATAEDSSAAAWAGQLDSFLNTTEENLLENIRKCWASLFTPRAIFYRLKQNMHKQKISVAVVVQKMVESEKSGIAFSVHPVTQDKNQLIIEAGFGLGEAIVSGQITPDSYVVEKEPRKIIEKNINRQEKKLVRAKTGGNEWQDIPKEKSETQVLSDQEILELSEIILQIEKHYGFPVDIEWAVEKSKFYVTQSRPITTLIDIDSGQDEQPRYFKNDVDWVPYLEREQPIYLFASFVRPYGEMLKRTTGFGFVHQLHYFRQGRGIFYRSSVEMRNADEYYLTLIRNNDERLLQWKKLGDKYNNVAKKLIRKFQAEPTENYIVANFKDLQNQCELIMLYGTVIPYRILSAINYAVENGESEEDFHNMLSLYEPLRAKTQYPALVEFVFSAFWKTAAKLTEVEEPHLFSLLAPDELEYVLTKPGEFDRTSIKKRLEGVAFWLDPNTGKFEFNSTASFLKEIGIQDQEIDQEVSKLKGTIANKGFAKGKACIVNNMTDANDFQEGDIIVSVNTNPSLMPILIKCGGIVTDEGGIMCHAAIVSRELNKPCVIGTKIATKVIKNGDILEVDANIGEVRILK